MAHSRKRGRTALECKKDTAGDDRTAESAGDRTWPGIESAATSHAVKFTLPILAIILGYTWVLAPVTPRATAHLTTLAVLGLAGWRAARTGDWGLRRSELLPAIPGAIAFTVPAVVAVYLAGSFAGTLQDTESRWGELAFLVAWAGGQQFALQTVLLREAQGVTSRRMGVVLAAAVFGVLHLPNPFLASVTLLAALAWCWSYDRHPNWLPLALSHAALTVAILYFLDPRLTGRLRIGRAYLSLE
jgi:membrane protease YdiL (CAAX protease family)